MFMKAGKLSQSVTCGSNGVIRAQDFWASEDESDKSALKTVNEANETDG